MLGGRQPVRQHLWLRSIWLALLVAVIVGSLLPAASPVMQGLDALDLNDKFEHFSAYAGLAFVPVLHETVSRLRILLPLIVVLGVLLEFGQLLSPGRTYDVFDMLADAAGVGAGLLLALPIRMRRRPAS